jgi:hypothetical protein
MVGVAQRHRGDAVRLGPADGVAHGMGRQHLAHRVAAVDDRDGAGIDHEGRLGNGRADAGLQPRQVPGQAQHAVRLVTPQVGLDQRVGDQPGICRRHAGCLIGGRRKVDQSLGPERRGAQLPSR